MEPKPETDEKYGELFRQSNGNYYFICYDCGEHFQLAETIINHIETVHFPTEYGSAEVKSEEIFVDVFPQCIGGDTNDNDTDADDGDDFKVYVDDAPTSIASDHEHPHAPRPPASRSSNSLLRQKPQPKIKAVPVLTCDYCMQEFPDKLPMESHMLTHLADRPFVCNVCRQQFKTKNLLNGHKKIAHATIDDIAVIATGLMCAMCVESFPNQKSYARHIRKKHTKYKCDQCPCQYNHRRNLLVHIKQKHLPANERPSYPCTQCGHKYITNAMLQDHIRVHHTDERPYICKICDARFHTR